MNESRRPDMHVRFFPSGGDEEPTLWWAAHRFMQGARRFLELQELLASTASNWASYPHVHRPFDQDDYETSMPDEDLRESRADAAALASEALGHFRATLDTAVYQLAWRGTGARPTGTMFPFCREAKHWKDRVRRDLRGVKAGYIAQIEDLQPFKGVAWTLSLATLSNRDKHDHTLEIVPIYQFRIDGDQEFADPEHPGCVAYAVNDPSVRFVFVPVDRVVNADNPEVATDSLIRIMVGIVAFLNPLLTEEGVSEIDLRSIG